MEALECRLCTGKDCLIDTFASNYTNGPSMRSYISLATGVEIKEDDTVSTRVCKTCLNATFNMYLFRVKSAKNDELLKEKAGLRKALEDSPSSTPFSDSIKREDEACNDEIAEFSRRSETTRAPNSTDRKNSRNIFDSNVHKSVKHALTLHPNVKLPEEVLACDISPQLVIKRCIDPTKIVPPVIISTGDISVVGAKRNAPDKTASASKRFKEKFKLRFKKPGQSPSTAGRLLETYYCEYCPETYTNKKKLRRHEAQHRRDLRELELRDTDLDQSLMVVSKTNHVYVCHICSEIFTNKKRLDLHVNEHNTCKYCQTLVTDIDTHLQTCTSAVMSHNYRVNLVRCDKDPAILAKYAKAFESDLSSSDGEDMTFMTNTFLSEKMKSTIPACDNSNNIITFHNLTKDLANNCRIDVNLVPNASKIKMEGSIAYENSIIDMNEMFNFLDIKPITIQAPKKIHLNRLMPISRADLQSMTNNSNKFESVNLKMGKDNEVLITKPNGETLKGSIVRVGKAPVTKLPAGSKDATVLNGSLVMKPPIFKPHAKPLLKWIMHNRAGGTSGAQKLNVSIKNVTSMANLGLDPKTISDNSEKSTADFAKIRIKQPWEINGS